MSFLRLRLVLRGYMRHRLLFALNLLSLIIGLVVCFLIGIFVTFELGFDKDIPDYERIYRVYIHGRISDLPIKYAVTMQPLGNKLQELFPEIEASCALERGSGSTQLTVGDTSFLESEILPVTPGFIDMFGVQVLSGDREGLLKAPDTIILTQSTAEKLFGEEDPLNKTVKLNRHEFAVVAIIADPPENMHFTYAMLIPGDEVNSEDPGTWGRFRNYTYIKLAENADPMLLEEKMKNVAMDAMQMKPGDAGMELYLALQSLKDIHLHSNLEYDIALTGNITYIYLFIAIGVFILALACINFAMLITANASIRSREIGISKVFGASRGILMQQFLRESMLLAVVAGLVSVLVILIIYPYFIELTGHEQMFRMALNWQMICAGLLLVLLTGFLAGVYPAFYLSGAEPVPILKGFIGGKYKSGRFRNLLTLFQFAISIVLISGTIAIYHQLRFIRHSDLGFKKDNVMFMMLMSSDIQGRGEQIKEELKKVSGVLHVGLSTGFPGAGACTGNGMHPEGEDTESIVLLKWINMDPEFMRTYEIQMVEGDTLRIEDYPNNTNILVNQTLAHDLGWDEPIGKKIYDLNRPHPEGQPTEYNIVGVYKDFHIRSFRESIEPLILFMREGSRPILNISIEENGREETLDRLEKRWKEIEPDAPFHYVFIEDQFDRLHTYETRLGSIFSWFAGLAILIACLGLFGLASFALKHRVKEIGIRKVLGSTNKEIARILVSDFVKWVLLANILAIPVAWYGIQRWINTFQFHAAVSPWIFIISAAIVMLIALVTILYHTIKASRMNPVEALKYE